MATFADQKYISIFNHYKKNYGKKSITIALLYVCLLEFSFILALGAFFKAFATQMKMVILSNTKFWVIFALIAVFIVFKNWMRYNGKKRSILNTKSIHNTHSLSLLWLMPVGCIVIACILLQV